MEAVRNTPRSTPTHDNISVQKTRKASQGIVFLNLLSTTDAVRFIYRFDDGPFYFTDAVQSSDWTLGPTIPFATKNFSVIAVNDATYEIISEKFVELPYFTLVLSEDAGINIIPLQDSFASSLVFLNFNGGSSPYRYLWINGHPLGSVAINPSTIALLIQSQQRNLTKDFTSINYELCDSYNNTYNCQRYLSPYLGVLKPAEDVWVVFTPIRQFQFTTYGPLPVVKPRFINSYYNITNNTGYAGASQLVFESDHQTFSPHDLRKFQRENNLPFTNLSSNYFGGVVTRRNRHFCSENGGNNCMEANLDVQIISSLSQHPTKTSLFYERDIYNKLGFAVAWILYLVDLREPPMVISVSYDIDERIYSPLLIELFDVEAVKVVIATHSFELHDGFSRLDLRESRSLFPAEMTESHPMTCDPMHQPVNTDQLSPPSAITSQ